MRRALPIIALLAIGPIDDARAQPRLAAQRPGPALRMTCAEAMDTVRRQGDVVLGQPGERFVRGRELCELSEVAELRFVPTRDNPQCPVGYRCREIGFEEWNW